MPDEQTALFQEATKARATQATGASAERHGEQSDHRPDFVFFIDFSRHAKDLGVPRRDRSYVDWTQPASTLMSRAHSTTHRGRTGDDERSSFLSWISIPLEENDMTRNLRCAIATGAVTTIALLALAVIASTPAYADDITVEQSPFVSSRTREEVSAEAKTPYPGGNPWSGAYNMFQSRSTATSEQIQGEYITNRDTANAFHGEDSGSVYILKAQSLAPSSASAMGAPAR
jgi:hypothetical protein